MSIRSTEDSITVCFSALFDFLLLSFPSLLPDFPCFDSCFCRGGFPTHRHGKVCIVWLGVCEEELAVCYLWHWCLYQLYDHHVSECGGCLSRLYLCFLRSRCWMNHTDGQVLGGPDVMSEASLGMLILQIVDCCHFLIHSWWTFLFFLSSGLWEGGLSAH